MIPVPAARVAERLADAGQPERAFDVLRGQSEFISQSGWCRAGVAGSSGAALLFGAIETLDPDGPWARYAHEHLKLAAREERPVMSLYGGLAGLLLTAKTLGRAQRRYAALVERLVGLVRMWADQTIAVPYEKPRYTHEFELISGAAGVAIALEGIEDAQAPELKRRIDDYLIWLCSDSAERWKAQVQFSPGMSCSTNNLGVSHGITGVLSALSFSPAPGAAGAVEALVDYLVAIAQDHGRGLRWPAAIDAGEALGSRHAWCYGTPGVAAVLTIAAKRIGRDDALELAIGALEAFWRSPRESWHLADSAICHGTAGVALCFESAARVTENSALMSYAARLHEEVLQAYDESAPYGYRAESPEGKPCDDATFLTGAVGIALSLLSPIGADRAWLRALALC